MRFLSLIAFFIFQQSPLFATDVFNDPIGPSGEFVVVALRMASDVESMPLGDTYENLLGQVVSFDEPKVWLDRQSFDGTRFVDTDVAVVDIRDPNLSDVTIPPLPIARVESRWIMEATQIVSEGKSVKTFLMVDRRVLIVPMANGALNVILEKPLDTQEIRRLQLLLKDTGNYNGDITGVMDQSTRVAIADYAEYRGAKFRFADPVISENLLAGLNVLN